MGRILTKAEFKPTDEVPVEPCKAFDSDTFEDASGNVFRFKVIEVEEDKEVKEIVEVKKVESKLGKLSSK